MDKDRIAGSAQHATGTVKQAAGDMLGDSKLQAEGMADRAAGNIRSTVGEAKDAAREEAEQSPEAEVRHLRQEVDQASAESAATVARVQGYVRQVDRTVDQKTDAVAHVVRDYPLAAVAGAAVAGFLLGRLMAGNTHVYRR